ncbi:MAG: AAA family ATPase [Deltaproteobacteria bacterium]|nr:AAA family ATPase [Deltaproteobacteria bacterium]
MGLLDRRLLVLTGKGGTGKSTMTAALALAASRRGKRVLVCEVTAKERVADLLGRPQSGPQIRELLPRLSSVHVRPQTAMREYGIMILRSEMLYDLVFGRKIVKYFLEAAPSLAEIVQLGKVTWHAEKDFEGSRRRFDLVILDAPATGHGLTLLTVPEVFLDLVHEGPLAADMKWMQALLQDEQRTQTCVVTMPEEMPVNEAIELYDALGKHSLPRGPVILNSVFAPRISEQERVAVARGGPLLSAVADAADAHEARAELSVRYEKVLREKVQQILPVPHVFDRQFGIAALERIGKALEPIL